jgi:hypothetical protein
MKQQSVTKNSESFLGNGHRHQLELELILSLDKPKSCHLQV